MDFMLNLPISAHKYDEISGLAQEFLDVLLILMNLLSTSIWML